jgi:anthranilate phosphoribosyltransferase
MTSPPKFADVYAELLGGKLSVETVRRVFDTIFDGGWTPTQIAGFVSTLRARNETPEVIAEAAIALRRVMVPVEHGLPRVMDTCGTGGDGHGTVNLSTGAAIIVAAAGIPVAKHGNRAVSSQTGSADVLEALGIPIDLPASSGADILREVGIAFLLAPTHHPAMRHAAVARRELGIRTIFNLLGPLANPARATHQLVGAPDDAIRPALAETLRALGSKRAWVVRGAEGLDEMSPSNETRVSVVTPNAVTELVVAPEDFGLERIPLANLRGGDARENAAALERVLSGVPHPALNGFVLNAAAALHIAGDLAPQQATDRVKELLAAGTALAVLDRWRLAAQKAKAASAVSVPKS